MIENKHDFSCDKKNYSSLDAYPSFRNNKLKKFRRIELIQFQGCIILEKLIIARKYFNVK